MNWFKDKKSRLVLIISAVVILCGFSMIPLSQKADNFPHDMWTNLIFLMMMAGGGGIGVVISLRLISKHSQKRCRTIQYAHINRLKKKAWTDFGAVCLMMIVIPLLYGFMTHADIKGLQGARYLMTGLVYTGFCVGFLIFLAKSKQEKQHLPAFDEREFHLIHKAISIGNNVFVGYTLLVTVAAFYIIGGRGMVPMWTIPLVLYGGMFIAGTVQFIVLMHHAKEDDKNIEGDVA